MTGPLHHPNRAGTVLVAKARRPRLAATVVAVVAPCLCLGLWWHWYSPRQVQTPEVPRSELASRDGRLYQTGQARPFTGALVEFYPGGLIRSRSLISNGLLHGISEGWHTNGQLEVREDFIAGVSSGKRLKWYASGAKMSEATIVGGRLHGTFQRWYENGVLAEQVEMRNGKADGLSVGYYPSGCLKARARLQAGEPIEQKFWEDGQIKEPPNEKAP